MAAGRSGAAIERGGRLVRLLTLTVRRFYADQCLTRASALAYTSLLSLVPLMAVMFAALKGLGAQARLEGLLLSRLSLDQDTTDLIISYIDRTNFGTLGAFGAAALVLTVISVLGNIEASLNAIWRVSQPRGWWRKVMDYLGVVLLTPFLLLAASALTSAGQVQGLVQWVLDTGYLGSAAVQALQLAPIAINALGIAILFAVMPNRRPAWGPLLVGALFAGLAWHVAQIAYVSLQIGVARNNAIYGALAQLPVTLVWLYVSWTVVLAGAELAAVLELGPQAALSAADMRRDAVALDLLVRAADAFRTGAPGIELTRVARALRLDLGVVQERAAPLVEHGWLIPVDEHPGRYVLGRAPEHISLRELAADADAIPARLDPRVHRVLAHRAADLWGELTLADVLEEGER